MLASQGDVVYGIQITTKNEQDRKCIEEIVESFQLLTE